MKLLPEKTTTNLLRILGYYAAVLYIVLMLAHAIFGSPFSARSLLGLAALDIVCTLVAGLGFWLQARLFFPIYTAGLGVGSLYMLIVVIFNTSPGWGDLTSVIGFLFIAVIGLGAGLAAELIRYLVVSRARPV